MANKIYLFLYEYHGDRKIGGVFSTRAAAEEALRLGDETSEVLEYEVDAPLPPNQPGRSLWNRYYSVDLPEYTGFPIPAYEPHNEVDMVTFDGKHYAVTVWALDEEDAVQQSVEKIERYRQAQTA